MMQYVCNGRLYEHVRQHVSAYEGYIIAICNSNHYAVSCKHLGMSLVSDPTHCAMLLVYDVWKRVR